MSLQDIQITNNQRKKLLKAMDDETILQQDEGVLVLNVAEYNNYKELSESSPVEDILVGIKLNYEAEYIVFD